jgi:beta-lactamase class A
MLRYCRLIPQPDERMLNMRTKRDAAFVTRRTALGAASAGLAASLGNRLSATTAHAHEATTASLSEGPDSLSVEILQAFRGLPGTVGLKLWAPAMAGGPEWAVSQNPDEQMFIASAFKAFVLAETLRQLEEAIDPASTTPPAGQFAAGLRTLLPLNDSVFMPGSTVLNPPHLSGEISLRTALEAMISHSDDTATDIVLKYFGAENVQAFVDNMGLTQTVIPASGAQFIGYIMGLPDWQQTTWVQLEADQFPDPRPILNDTITMASSPADLVSFYSRTLTGEMFQRETTLATYRTILSWSDAVPQAIPLGANGFGKGGQVSASGSNALSFAGGMYVPNRWIYFAMLLNWSDAEGNIADVEMAYFNAVRHVFTLVRDAFSR